MWAQLRELCQLAVCAGHDHRQHLLSTALLVHARSAWSHLDQPVDRFTRWRLFFWASERPFCPVPQQAQPRLSRARVPTMGFRAQRCHIAGRSCYIRRHVCLRHTLDSSHHRRRPSWLRALRSGCGHHVVHPGLLPSARHTSHNDYHSDPQHCRIWHHVGYPAVDHEYGSTEHVHLRRRLELCSDCFLALLQCIWQGPQEVDFLKVHASRWHAVKYNLNQIPSP